MIMTREEEIEQQAFVYYESCSDEDIAKSKGFIDGAKWADKTMIERVCEWLKDNANDYLDWYDWEECRLNTDNLLYDFKQAMEEQL